MTVSVSHLAATPLSTETSLTTLPRLIVLVPYQEMDDNKLARQVWTLAAPSCLKVLYMGLCPNTAKEYHLRRRLATLVAITRDDRVFAEAQLELENDWLRTVKAVWCPGDIIVCHAEQTVGLRRRPISQVLLSTLQAPTCILNGFYSPPPFRSSPLLRQATSWAGNISIIAGFFWMQVSIERIAEDWAHTALLYLSVVLEYSLIWIWNYLSS